MKIQSFSLIWLEWTQKSFSHFFYSRIHSRIFSSLNHKIRELMPPKRENSPNLCYYIYCHARFVWLASECLKTYSTKGNMVIRLSSGININCKKSFVKKEQRYVPIRSPSDSSDRPNGQCELTQDHANLLFFIGFGEFI